MPTLFQSTKGIVPIALSLGFFLITVTRCTKKCVFTPPFLWGPMQSGANPTNSSQSFSIITEWRVSSLPLVYYFGSYILAHILCSNDLNRGRYLWIHLNFTSQCLVLDHDLDAQALAVRGPSRPALASFQLSAVDQLCHPGTERRCSARNKLTEHV